MKQDHGTWWQWEESRGPLSHLDPTVRMFFILLLLVAALVVNPTEIGGGLLTALVVFLACLGSGTSIRLFSKVILLGLAVFLPVFLLTPWMGGSQSLFIVPGLGSVTRTALTRATVLVIRGVVSLLLGLALSRILDATDLTVAIARLPLPRIVVVMVLQVGRWVGVLLRETRGIAQALALRGTGRGLSGSWTVLSNLPTVWLPRVTRRAGRVAQAMEVRSYRGQLPDVPFEGLSIWDMGAALLGLLLLVAALVTRAWSG